MRAERFGSYSIAATVAGTPSLSRLKSIDAVAPLVAAAAMAHVMRPRLLRPPDFAQRRERAPARASPSVISAKSKPVWKRRPGDVGLYWIVGMVATRSLEEVDALPSASVTYAFFQSGRSPDATCRRGASCRAVARCGPSRPSP